MHHAVNERRVTIEATRKRARVDAKRSADNIDFNLKKLRKPVAR
jgi:hypothetical protein